MVEESDSRPCMTPVCADDIEAIEKCDIQSRSRRKRRTSGLAQSLLG
jgi:hypothetical protein